VDPTVVFGGDGMLGMAADVLVALLAEPAAEIGIEMGAGLEVLVGRWVRQISIVWILWIQAPYSCNAGPSLRTIFSASRRLRAGGGFSLVEALMTCADRSDCRPRE